MMYSERRLPDIEQWLQRHPEAGTSWPSWPKASYLTYNAIIPHDEEEDEAVVAERP